MSTNMSLPEYQAPLPPPEPKKAEELLNEYATFAQEAEKKGLRRDEIEAILCYVDKNLSIWVTDGKEQYLKKEHTGLARTIEYIPATKTVVLHFKQKTKAGGPHGTGHISVIKASSIVASRSLPKWAVDVADKVPKKSDKRPNAIEKMRKEAEITSQFADAKNVRRMYRISEKGLLLEGMSGGTLRQNFGRFTSDQKARIARDCLNGLREIHDKRLVHRDIHSENIFLTAEGTAKIGDLECAERIGTHDDGQGNFYTFSPQRINALVTGEPYLLTDQDDVWSLGLSLYELEHVALPSIAEPKSMDILADAIEDRNKTREAVKTLPVDIQKEIFCWDGKSALSLPGIADEQDKAKMKEIAKRYYVAHLKLTEVYAKYLDAASAFVKGHLPKSDFDKILYRMLQIDPSERYPVDQLFNFADSLIRGKSINLFIGTPRPLERIFFRSRYPSDPPLDYRGLSLKEYFMRSLAFGDLSGLKEGMKTGKDFANWRGPTNESFLHLASGVRWGKVFVALLLENGAKNINSDDLRGYSPLDYAIQCESPDTCKVLIQAGAEFKNNEQFLSLLKLAKEKKDSELLTMLMQRNDIIQNCGAGIVDLGLQLNAQDLILPILTRKDIQFSNEYIEALPAKAMQLGRLDLLKTLIEKPADFPYKVRIDTPKLLQVALQMGSMEALSLVFEGQKLDAAQVKTLLNTFNDNGMTPLMLSVSKGQSAFVKYMLKNGADPVVKNIDGLNAAKIAAKYSTIDTFHFVLEFCPEGVREEIKGELFDSFLQAAYLLAETDSKMRLTVDHMKATMLDLARGPMADKRAEEIVVRYFTDLAKSNETEKIVYAVRIMGTLSKYGELPLPCKEALKVAIVMLSNENQATWQNFGPTDSPRNTYRTPSEVLVHLMSALKKENLPELERKAEMMMRTHHMTFDQVKAFLAEVKALTPAGSRINSLCTILENQLPKRAGDVALTRLHDNIYGNVYDSAIALNLVNEAPAEVVSAMNSTSKALETWFKTNLTKEEQLKVASQFQTYIQNEDPRFFFQKMPLVLKLRDARNSEEALNCLLDYLHTDKSGLESLYLTTVVCRLSLYLHDIGKAPWMIDANANYDSFIIPRTSRLQRKTAKLIRSKGGGITKLSQPPAFKESWMEPSQRSASVNILNIQNPTEVARTALEHGIPWASAVSGTTNINLFAMKFFQDHGAKIDSKHFMLGVIILLVYDGGHSIHEALWTANQLDHLLKLGIGLTAVNDPGTFLADFEKLEGIFKDTPTAAPLGQAIARATDAVLDYFEKNSFFAKAA